MSQTSSIMQPNSPTPQLCWTLWMEFPPSWIWLNALPNDNDLLAVMLFDNL